MLTKLKSNSLIKLLRQIASNSVPYAWHVAIFFAAALSANGVIYGDLRPFAIAVCAAVPPAWAFSAGIGAAVGYGLALDVTLATPYLAAICIIAVARFILTNSKKRWAIYAPCVLGSITLAAIKSIFIALEGAAFAPVLAAFAESAVFTGLFVLLRELFNILAVQGSFEINAPLLAGYITLICLLMPFTLLSLRLSFIIMGGCLLCASSKGKPLDSVALGAAGIAAVSACAPSYLFAACGLCVAALAASVFSQSSRAYTALVFFCGGLTGVLAAPSATLGLLLGVELCVSCIAYLLMPSSLLAKGGYQNREARREATAQLSSRLDTLAASLSSVGETVSEVCKKLPPKGESYADVCDCIAQNVCGSCKRRMFCWVDCYSDTMQALQELAPELSSSGFVQANSLNELLLRRCLMPERLSLGITLEYSAWQARRAAKAQGEIMRGALREQFSALAHAIESFSAALWREDMPDRKKALRVEELMYSLGVQPFDVRVAQDIDNRMHAEIRMPKASLSQKDLQVLTDEISDICRCSFSQAQCTQQKGVTVLDFYEKALFDVQFALHCISAKAVCGDACRTFCDGHGMAYALLCDGMGTGQAAAIDGNMAASLSAQLIQAGFTAKQAARLVNVALSLKSEEEAGATLDALAINLYTGRASIFKAGAAPTFLVHCGKAISVNAESLPMGILGTVQGKECEIQLSRGDLVVMVSDGAISDGEEWFAQQLELTVNEPLDQLCQKAAEAARRRSSSRPDDITVLAAKVE